MKYDRASIEAAMTSASSEQAQIIQTERGQSIAGWTTKVIRSWLPLTEEQLNAALSYIDAHRDEVEAEYQDALQETQALREYWDEKNRDRLAQIAKLPPKPGQEEIHAKLQTWKAKLGLSA